uniref:Uncharacterized protein n=1 Tax=Acrobeloides nanus TaxID=290746 RepID=A0A914CSB7_9BILA
MHEVEQGVAILDYLDEKDPFLVYDEETMEVMKLEAEELNFRQAEGTADLMTAEEMADFKEFEYLLDEGAEVEN